ncbi:CUB and sushi domain-containing protein 3-like [Strongylocentrotus purpuratus]|uniref:Sushi domain-containing protein n=1 Tax=Strongylocentrotus purpuratus TaxID=7668 RepID=A0A7M7P2G6_STRPU|nr:CUB and sushi domain-containing protein 3-like [Strongylocentrotus purpuratus]
MEFNAGSIPCSTPYVPPHSTVENLRLNYNFTDKVNVTCDASGSTFTLQCHNKGLWSGPVVSCPPPALLEPSATVAAGKAQCSAPAVPLDSNIQNLRLSYKHRDIINVTCNEVTNGVPEWFELSCVNGIWNGQNIVCPDPVKECNQPILPADSSVNTIRARYKIGTNVNITCKSASVSFVWICDKDGLWRGSVVWCPVPQPPNGGAAAGRFGNKEPQEKQNGRNVFITGLLVAAVIMFILVLMSMVAFSISVKGRSFGPSKHSLQDERTDRGPLPEVPAGYADYLVGDKSLYTAPYLKPDEIHHSYETYEKPI